MSEIVVEVMVSLTDRSTISLLSSPEDFISAFVRENMNASAAMIAATQRLSGRARLRRPGRL
jgi:hypothetical protein